MRITRGSGWLVVAALVAACTVKTARSPSARRDLPFDPTTIRADPDGVLPKKGPFRVNLAVRVTKPLTAADGVALRVVSDAGEVVRAPVEVALAPAGIGETSKVFTAAVELPLGDYEVELVYRDRPILGHAFKLAEVPVWGGGRQVHFAWHQKNRVDLDAERLLLARWVVEDEPTQAYVIEWWQKGKRVHVTRGRTEKWPVYQLEPAMLQAYPRKDAAPRKSIWAYGTERYPIPKDLVLIGGMWEARVYREGAPPVAVTFELTTGAETQDLRAEWKGAHLSAELFLRPLPHGLGAAAFTAIPGKQLPTVEANRGETLVDPIGFDRAAMRALFRAPELARLWLEFRDANGTTPLATEDAWNLTAEEKALLAQRARPASGNGNGAGHGQARGAKPEDDLAKVTRLRPQILALIKKHGGPWQPDEVPR